MCAILLQLCCPVPSDLAIPRLPKPPSQPGLPRLARLTLSGHAPSHVQFYSFFAEHAANALALPHQSETPEPIVRRYRINRSPFAQAKRKDLFEQKIYRKVIEVKGRAVGSADAWEWWIRKNAPPGIKVEVERWKEERLGFGKAMKALEQEWRKQNADIINTAREKGEDVRSIESRFLRPTDDASVVMRKVNEFLTKWSKEAADERSGQKKKKASDAAADGFNVKAIEEKKKAAPPAASAGKAQKAAPPADGAKGGKKQAA